MSYDSYIGMIDAESVLAECGPMRLVIRAWNVERPQLKLAHQAAERSISYLERIAQCRAMLSRPWPQIESLPEDLLARRMVSSVTAIGDDDLTPMAAVAGTIADAVADWLFDKGATKVIVDNGGDVAIRLVEGESATVGVRPQVNSPHLSHVIRLQGQRSTWGVTTSGMGGRSFTRGIASAVSVLAANASIADAASTAVANACFVADSSIIQQPAESVDSNSDLRGTNITTDAGPLDSAKIGIAINHAKQKAESLSHREIIIGAFIALGGVCSISNGMQHYISPAVGQLSKEQTNRIE
jgi:ApbE superfamily uncharacterized protein (UPF0280 family)